MEGEWDEVMELSQEGTVQAYCDEFQFLFNQVNHYEDISECYAIYLFITGLKQEIRDVFMQWHQHSLQTVKEALSLALKLDSNGLKDTLSSHDPSSSLYITMTHQVFDEKPQREKNSIKDNFQDSVTENDKGRGSENKSGVQGNELSNSSMDFEVTVAIDVDNEEIEVLEYSEKDNVVREFENESKTIPETSKEGKLTIRDGGDSLNNDFDNKLMPSMLVHVRAKYNCTKLGLSFSLSTYRQPKKISCARDLDLKASNSYEGGKNGDFYSKGWGCGLLQDLVFQSDVYDVWMVPWVDLTVHGTLRYNTNIVKELEWWIWINLVKNKMLILEDGSICSRSRILLIWCMCGTWIMKISIWKDDINVVTKTFNRIKICHSIVAKTFKWESGWHRCSPRHRKRNKTLVTSENLGDVMVIAEINDIANGASHQHVSNDLANKKYIKFIESEQLLSKMVQGNCDFLREIVFVNSISAPRLLKLTHVDSFLYEKHNKFHGVRISVVTSNWLETIGRCSEIWNFQQENTIGMLVNMNMTVGNLKEYMFHEVKDAEFLEFLMDLGKSIKVDIEAFAIVQGKDWNKNQQWITHVWTTTCEITCVGEDVLLITILLSGFDEPHECFQFGFDSFD